MGTCETHDLDARLEQNIKELLDEFPAMGDILNSYGIGCVTCAVGTCAMKDILEYHALPEAQARELMARLAAAMGLSSAPAEASARPEPAAPRVITYSEPMQCLVDEHTLIKRWLAVIPAFARSVNLDSEADRRRVLSGVAFIRAYADRFHHAKEEDILFTRFDGDHEIIRVMLEDHVTGRRHVQGMQDAVAARDLTALTAHLLGYRDLLTEHIRKEDEILYPWMDRQLTPDEIEELAQAFRKADDRAAPGLAERFARFIESIE
ncbi:MAG: Hemerythrin HHE cation binding domain protein [bacterium ADurb.Bin429]|nr:MAG: Hemerythrin HHE cation binding domain protein [bacterium ADurb.Bin429]